MFAWTSVQAIFCTPGGKLFRESKQMREMGEDFVLQVCGGGKSFSLLHQPYRQSIQWHGSRGHNRGCQEPLLDFFEHFFSMC